MTYNWTVQQSPKSTLGYNKRRCFLWRCANEIICPHYLSTKVLLVLWRGVEFPKPAQSPSIILGSTLCSTSASPTFTDCLCTTPRKKCINSYRRRNRTGRPCRKQPSNGLFGTTVRHHTGQHLATTTQEPVNFIAAKSGPRPDYLQSTKILLPLKIPATSVSAALIKEYIKAMTMVDGKWGRQ